MFLEVAMGVKVREKRGKLYLDIYNNGKRSWESLHLTLTKDKAQNKELMRLADICRSQRESQLLTGKWNIQDQISGKKKFVTFIEEHTKDYSSPGVMKSFLRHVKNFYTGDTVLLSQITSKWVTDFQEYLEKESGLSQMSAAHYSKILHATIKKAVQAGVIARNPCENIKRITEPETDLVYLNIDEIQKLADTKPADVDGEIRRAFLFACHTGLRVCDLETITWGDIETNPMQIIKRQVKTKTAVYIPLSDTVKKLIYNDGNHEPADKLFSLPHDHRRQSYTPLKRWAKASEIAKNIGWHTARRTFATLALESGAEIYTVAKLLGLTSIKHVVKYAKVTDKLRRAAVDALPEIRL
jgi:integrase